MAAQGAAAVRCASLMISKSRGLCSGVVMMRAKAAMLIASRTFTPAEMRGYLRRR